MTLLMCVSVWPVCMYVHHVHAWFLRRSEEASDPQGLELQLAAMWVLGAEPRGYGRAASLLTHEPSFQPPKISFYLRFLC